MGLRQKPKGSCVHTASIQKADHRKQIPRNRIQISRNRKQKGVRIQGQIPERRWQNPAVLEFCFCTSHIDGSRILGNCTDLEFSKASWKRFQVPTRQITCWVQNRSTMARAPSLKALARRHQGYLSSCSSGVGSQGARRRRRRWRLRFCGDAARGGRAANSGGLMHALRQRRGWRGMKEATAVAVRLSGDAAGGGPQTVTRVP